jgi:hypothetical protein
MKHHTRRRVLRMSLLTVAGPLGSNPFVNLLSAQTTQPPVLNTSLLDYVMDGMAQTVAKMHTHTVQPHDFLVQAKKMRLLASHFKQIGVDDSVKAALKSPESRANHVIYMSNLDLSNSPEGAAALKHIQQYDPSMRAADLRSPSKIAGIQGQWESAVNEVASNGISKHFGDMADLMEIAATQANVVPLAYGGVSDAHLQRVECPSSWWNNSRLAATCGFVTTLIACAVLAAVIGLCATMSIPTGGAAAVGCTAAAVAVGGGGLTLTALTALLVYLCAMYVG